MHIIMTLSGRLKANTQSTHASLDEHILGLSPFGDLERYGRFVGMQWAFFHDIAALYQDEALNCLLPGLAERSRLGQVEDDLSDLGLAPQKDAIRPYFAVGRASDVPTALGWLYVAEGSNLGASLLRKMAMKLGLSDDHGARHLSPGTDGPAAHWRAFTSVFDALEQTSIEEARTVAGAKAAFARVRSHVDRYFG